MPTLTIGRPLLRTEFKKITTLRGRVKTLESAVETRDGTIKGLQNSAKVATARKLRDEVTAYQREVARLRAQLEERTAEAEGATPIPLLSAVLLAECSGLDCADQLRV